MLANMSKNWRVEAEVEADTPASAVRAFHGALSAQPGIVRITQTGMKPLADPWRSMDTAPRKNEQKIIGYNAQIQYAETVTWSEDRKTWLDFDMNPVPLTHWMPQYEVIEQDELDDEWPPNT